MMNKEEVMALEEDIKKKVYVSDKIIEYMINIIEATRSSKYLTAGISTRGALAMHYTARTNAYFNGRDFVIPEDIKELAEYLIPHRVIFREEYEHLEKREIVLSLIEEIPAPV